MPAPIQESPKWNRRPLEQGFVMVTAVLFLLVLTILGLSSMGGTILEEKMTGFYRDRQIAFEAAEAALRDGELDALSSRISGGTGFAAGCGTTTTPVSTADSGLCAVETDGTPIWVDFESDSTKKTGWVNGDDENHSVLYHQFTVTDPVEREQQKIPGVAKQPRYIIEAIKVATQQLKLNASQSYKYAYRITAVGFGRRATTRVLLQSIVTSS
jgi:type IV pilus assembly protein PilX